MKIESFESFESLVSGVMSYGLPWRVLLLLATASVAQARLSFSLSHLRRGVTSTRPWESPEELPSSRSRRPTGSCP